ncbi:hypothetical protein D4R78_07860 [bacterium]|nr:MAG: hypothetical protein D4R78_07860 [bacterium]
MKRYLTGIDWVINSIDYLGKSQSGIGNVSEVIMELQGQLDDKILQKALRRFLQNSPIINGFPSRDFNLCPYWKMFPQKEMLPLRVNVKYLESYANPLLPLERQVNEPFRHEREHLVFNLVRAGKRNLLGLTFDHRLLDARGTEAFLDLFQRYYQEGIIPQVSLSEPSRLNRWAEKFMAGRQVNRFFLGLSKSSPRILPSYPGSRICKFKIISFDVGQTNHIIEIAHEQAGYLMFMPFILAKTIQVLHHVFEAKNTPGLTYLVPVSIDTRTQERVHKELFFNHMSFFFFRINADKADDFKFLVADIKEQMYEQVKVGLPDALRNASFLLRIASLPLVIFFLQLMSKKHFASFSFSFVGSAYNSPKFMDEEVQNIFHLPRVPNPPGIGIFFNQFNGRLNATLSYFDGVLSENEVERIASELNSIGNDG